MFGRDRLARTSSHMENSGYSKVRWLRAGVRAVSGEIRSVSSEHPVPVQPDLRRGQDEDSSSVSARVIVSALSTWCATARGGSSREAQCRASAKAETLAKRFAGSFAR